MDVRSIHAGQRFDREIADKISSSDVTLVIIGDRWAADDRLNDPEDWVRQEIVESLKRPDRTIPILLDDATFAGSQLPQDLQPLTMANAITIRHVSFDSDMESFVLQLRKLLKHWDEDTLLVEASAADSSGVTANKLKAVFDWARHRGFPLAWGKGQYGSFWLQPLGTPKTVFSATGRGESYIYLSAMKELRYLKDEEACRNFIAEMNKIPNLRIPGDRAAALSFGFQLKSIVSIRKLIDLLDKTLQRPPQSA